MKYLCLVLLTLTSASFADDAAVQSRNHADAQTRRHLEAKVKDARQQVDKTEGTLEQFNLKLRIRDTVCYLLGYRTGPSYEIPKNASIQKIFEGKTQLTPSDICLVLESTPAEALSSSDWKNLADAIITQKRAFDKQNENREAMALKNSWDYVQQFVSSFFAVRPNDKNGPIFVADLQKFNKHFDPRTVSNDVYLEFSDTVRRWEAFVRYQYELSERAKAIDPQPSPRRSIPRDSGLYRPPKKGL